MVKQTNLNTILKFSLPYRLAHSDIPKPRIGFSPDWAGYHAGLPDMILDHASCPGIQARERIGITLSMPYNCRFYRDGHLEIDTYWQEGGPQVYRFEPKQELVTIRHEGDKFPGFAVTLPTGPELKFSLSMFVLGDVRLGAWIIQAGIQLSDLPENYTLLFLPLPNHRYPLGYSCGQAVAFSLSSISGQLKIPLDVDLSALPPDQDHLAIARGTPMMQYLAVKLPALELIEETEGEGS